MSGQSNSYNFASNENYHGPCRRSSCLTRHHFIWISLAVAALLINPSATQSNSTDEPTQVPPLASPGPLTANVPLPPMNAGTTVVFTLIVELDDNATALQFAHRLEDLITEQLSSEGLPVVLQVVISQATLENSIRGRVINITFYFIGSSRVKAEKKLLHISFIAANSLGITNLESIEVVNGEEITVAPTTRDPATIITETPTSQQPVFTLLLNFSGNTSALEAALAAECLAGCVVGIVIGCFLFFGVVGISIFNYCTSKDFSRRVMYETRA